MLLLPSLLPVEIADWFFSPAVALSQWQDAPLTVALSPLVSQFAQVGLFSAAFDAILLLVAGRHVERALGPVGVVLTFVAGAYGGALARLLLTPGSATPGFAANGAVFALIGAYLILYGVPRGIPIAVNGSRLRQVVMLALAWAGLQLVFMLATMTFDLSVALIEPLGGLAAGVAVARPLLAWRYRRA